MKFVESDDNHLRINLCALSLTLSKSKCWDNSPGPYGYYTLIKQYADVPYWFKGITVQHGWAPADIPDMNDVLNAKHLMLCMSRRDKENFEKKSTVRCEIAGAPFVHYRRRLGIEIATDAQGTIAFPAHSVPGLYAEFDLDRYCAELNALPEQFHPITVCLHPSDITHFALDKKYQAHGLRTASAGVGTDKPFYQAFYDILRKHKYATSNEPGSYLFYTVEMGIPFFMLGESAKRDNSVTKNIDVPLGIYSILDLKHGKIAYDMFSGSARDVITPTQRQYVINELGMEDCLSPKALRNAFWDVATKRHFRPSAIRQSILALATMVKYPYAMRRLPSFFATVWKYGRKGHL